MGRLLGYERADMTEMRASISSGQEISAKDDLRRVLVGGGWAFSGKVLAMVAGVAGNALLTRLLTPSEAGAYFLILSIASVAVLLAQMGLNQAIVRYVAASLGKGQTSRIRDAVMKCFMVVSVAAVLFAILYVASTTLLGARLFHTSLVKVASMMVAAWIVVTSLRTLAAETLRGFHDIRLATLFEGLLTSILFFLLLLGIWANGQHVLLRQVIGLALLSTVLSALFALWSVWRRISPFEREPVITIIELLQTGLPLLVSNVTVVLMTSFGLWAVGALTTVDDAALYATAQRLAILIQFPLLALNAIVPPMAARMHARNETRALEHVLRLLAAATFAASLLGMAIFVIWGKQILAVLFGAYYADAYWILLLLVSGIVANAWAGFCGPVLMMTGHQQSLMRLSVLALFIMLPVAVLLGVKFGAEGVAAGMSFGLALLHGMMWMAVRRRLSIRTDAAGFAMLWEVFHAR